MKITMFYIIALFAVVTTGEHIEVDQTRNHARPAITHVAC